MKQLPHLRRADHRGRQQGGPAGRHPDQPRPALRDQRATGRSRDVMTRENLDHRAGRHDARRGAGDPAPAQGREAAGRRRDFRLKGLITVKDIQKLIKYPNACKDALGRLRVGRGRRRRQRHDRARRRRWSTPTSTCSSSTPRTATRRACSTWSRRIRRRIPGRRARRRQRGHGATAHRGPDRPRGRRGQGRHRRRVDLHDARRGRRRRAADHRDRRVRAGRAAARTCRSSPTAASGSPATSPRRWPPAPAR